MVSAWVLKNLSHTILKITFGQLSMYIDLKWQVKIKWTQSALGEIQYSAAAVTEKQYPSVLIWKVTKKEAHTAHTLDFFWNVLHLSSCGCRSLHCWGNFNPILMRFESEKLHWFDWGHANSFSCESDPLSALIQHLHVFPASVKNLSHSSLLKLLFHIPVIQFILQSWKNFFWIIFSAPISFEMQTFPVFNLSLSKMFSCLSGNWHDIIHSFQVFLLLLFIMSFLGRQEMFVFLENCLCIWFVEEFMNSYLSCYWRYKNNR